MLKRRLILTSILIDIALFLMATLSQVEILPCQSFADDSDEVRYVFCPLINEYGEVLLMNDDTYTRTTIWTWLSLLVYLGIIPYGLSMLWIRRRKP